MRGRDAPKELARREGAPIALDWTDASLAALRDYSEWLALGDVPEPRDRALVESALAINFSLPAAMSRESREPFVAAIADTFTRARGVIARSGRFFVGVSARAAERVFRTPNIPPAYAIFGKAVYFTPRFAPYDPTTGRGFGPLCRAAMVLHESVHVIDRVSGQPEIHVSEWDEPRFSAQTASESVHNPSAYASFGAQVFTRAMEWPRDARYGAGRPAD